jgi:ABC-type arginine/histidine transport system permease subunit
MGQVIPAGWMKTCVLLVFQRKLESAEEREVKRRKMWMRICVPRVLRRARVSAEREMILRARSLEGKMR